MSFRNVLTRNVDAILGRQPHRIYGTILPNGTQGQFLRAQIGTEYFRTVTDNQHETWVKMKEDRLADDWWLVQGNIHQTVLYSDATASTTTGTVDLNGTIPAGCFYERTLAGNVIDFVGQTTVTFTLGEPGGDVDRYHTGTPSVAATAAVLAVGVVSGTAFHAAAITPRLIFTADTEYASITAGKITLNMQYTGRFP